MENTNGSKQIKDSVYLCICLCVLWITVYTLMQECICANDGKVTKYINFIILTHHIKGEHIVTQHCSHPHINKSLFLFL